MEKEKLYATIKIRIISNMYGTINLNAPKHQTFNKPSLFDGSFTLWFSGLSGSGKSTLAKLLKNEIIKRNRNCILLDGDIIRTGLNQDLGFSQQERTENIRRVAHMAKLLNDQGVIVIAAFISPLHSQQELAQKIISKSKFKLVYLNTSLEVCEQRDPKGLYKRARNGEIPEFTGIDSIYEKPKDYFISLDTSTETELEVHNHILRKL